jgi:Domain of unknown function (DUF4304)
VGFKKKADSWYMDSDDIILVINLQKSAYGPQYYINVALWLKPLGEADCPKEHRCHIRSRWDSLVAFDEKHLARLLDLEAPIADNERQLEIAHILKSHVVPFLSKVSTLDGVRSVYQTASWPSSLVNRSAQEFLSGEVRDG